MLAAALCLFHRKIHVERRCVNLGCSKILSCLAQNYSNHVLGEKTQPTRLRLPRF